MYRYWQVLHRRVALGETLSTAEQAVYESGCQEMDAKERLGSNLERLRELRAQIAAAETEQQRLQAREAELDARIVAIVLPTLSTPNREQFDQGDSPFLQTSGGFDASPHSGPQ